MDLMSQQRLNFMKFMDDCAVYCIASWGLQYQPLQIPEGYTTYFSNDYGEAVLQYHGAHEEMYRMRIRKRSSSKILTHEGLQEYMLEGIKKCFQEQATMEGMLMFCSLYIDTAIYCFRYETANLINESLVSTVSLVFEEYVKILFDEMDASHITALWHEIRQIGINLVEREKATAQN
ncbi:hypothetical protein AVEN_236206-1 [Araneus ventricosus]|uniref:Uncharacterized protein n=1 Tax=Araneus ventricosus TaxID=182803 RepID=A0A4Y2CAN2_ARAVE|nr:hypothetical protein AVEN_236206-1 [Araneus ventricosus]